MAQDTNDGSVRIKVIRASVESVSLFEITDYELEILEKGAPSSTYFNFAVFALSVGASFLLSITTTVIASDRLFTVYTVISVLGLAAGVFLLILWARFRSSTTAVCARIRARVPAVDVPEPAASAATGEGSATESAI